MTEPKSYVLKLADGRDEPIKDLDGASRTILIDEETGFVYTTNNQKGDPACRWC